MIISSASLGLVSIVDLVGALVCKRRSQGNDGFLSGDIVLVPFACGLVVHVQVDHVNAELTLVERAKVLDPIASLTFDVL